MGLTRLIAHCKVIEEQQQQQQKQEEDTHKEDKHRDLLDER